MRAAGENGTHLVFLALLKQDRLGDDFAGINVVSSAVNELIAPRKAALSKEITAVVVALLKLVVDRKRHLLQLLRISHPKVEMSHFC